MTASHPPLAAFGLPARFLRALEEGLAAVEAAPDTVRIVSYLLERAADTGALATVPDDAQAGTALARIAYAAPFLIHHAATVPERLSALLGDFSSSAPLPWSQFAHPAEFAGLDEAEAMRRIRLWKYASYFRLTARDVLGVAGTQETCRGISDLADAVTRVALAWACGTVARTQGLPVRHDGALSTIAVLGMGKLGGQELNYSSDIDLVLLHDADEETTRRVEDLEPPPYDPAGDDAAYWRRWRDLAARAGEGRPGRITNGEWHQRVGKQLLRLLSTKTGEGIAFRADVDLRPEGKAGPLVTPVTFALTYYDVQGREWERTALIKARPVAGDAALTGHFLQAIRPFVYRRYLDYSAMEGIALVKHDIDRHHQGGLTHNLKLGAGGIRENEFLVQALQLLYGGRRPEIQVTNHAAAVHALSAAGILAPDDAASILADYWLLRERENRVQMVEERQTQELPEDPAEHVRVMHDFAPGFAARLPAADAALTEARNRIAQRFRALFRDMAQASGNVAPAAADWQEALRANSPPDDVPDRLARVDALINRLMRTRIGERCVFKLTGLLTRPELYVTGTAEAFPRWLGFLEQMGNRNALFTLLEANPPIVPWVSRIFAEGGVHAEPLIRHPEFLETYLGGSASGDEALRARFDAILEKSADEEEFIVEVQMAKAQAQIQILSLCLADAEADTYRRQLSTLADETLRVIVGFAWRALTRRLGLPEGATEGDVRDFAVLAMGKHGTQELRFSSDLDLVFVYEGAGTTSAGRSHYELFTKLAHKVSNLLTTPTQFGKLYDLDHRLRPFGNKGLLAPSYAGFQDFLSQAEVWNFQAFTRLRPVAGDLALAARLAPAVSQEWRRRAMPRERIAENVQTMLERLVAGNAAPGVADGKALPLKFAVGGMLGVEFLRQFHFLAAHAEGGDDWEAAPPHPLVESLAADYDLLNALDERVSFYRHGFQHAVTPADFHEFAAVKARWTYAAIAEICERVRRRVTEGFATQLR